MRILIILLIFFVINTPVCGFEKEAVSSGNKLYLTLRECVYLALENNFDLKDAYVTRKLQQYNYQIAENSFFPKLQISAGADTSKGDPNNYSFNVRPHLSLKMPTGGDFSFSWSNILAGPDKNYASGMSMVFSQPLLSGFGVAGANLERSRINEKVSVLNLKDTISDTILNIISSYYSLLRAQRAVIDSEEAFKKAKKTLNTSKLLLNMGRIAKVDLLQTEADVANQELSNVSSVANLEFAKTKLLEDLELAEDLDISVAEDIDISEPESLEFSALLKIAKTRPSYQIALYSHQKNQITYQINKSNQQVNVALSASVSESGSGSSYREAVKDSFKLFSEGDWRVGLSTSYDFDRLAEDADVLSNEYFLKQSKRNIKKTTKLLKTEIATRIRDVKASSVKYKLAKKAKELAEKFVEIEQDKLRLGLSSNFKVIALQNNLKDAREQELEAKFSYFKNLSLLDKSLGTTLDTWKIEFKEE
jgi:outer membrane protein